MRKILQREDRSLQTFLRFFSIEVLILRKSAAQTSKLSFHRRVINDQSIEALIVLIKLPNTQTQS